MSTTRTESLDAATTDEVARTHRGDVPLDHIPPAHAHPTAPAPAAEVSVLALPPVANGVPTSVFGFAAVVTMLSLVTTGPLGSGALLVPLFMIIGFLAIGIGGLDELRNGDISGGTSGVVHATFLLATGVSLKFFAPAADASVVHHFGDEVGSLFLLFALISVISALATKAAGHVGLLDGVAAFWLATGILMDVMHGKQVMPLGAPAE